MGTHTLSLFGLDSSRKNPRGLKFREGEVETLIAAHKDTNTQAGMTLEAEIATGAEADLHTTGVDLLLVVTTQITTLVGAVAHPHGSCLRSTRLQGKSLRSA